MPKIITTADMEVGDLVQLFPNLNVFIGLVAFKSDELQMIGFTWNRHKIGDKPSPMSGNSYAYINKLKEIKIITSIFRVEEE